MIRMMPLKIKTKHGNHQEDANHHGIKKAMIMMKLSMTKTMVMPKKNGTLRISPPASIQIFQHQ